MTSAALRLGRGDLESRVAVRGNDELAELGRSFNRMADSLRRSEERQRLLVADVAHELRTPLSNLRGYLEALSDGVVAPSPELFASLHEEAVLQQRIVDDLQELALADAGNLAYHRTPVDLEELLETCRTAHRALAESAGVSLTVHAEPDGTAGRLVVFTDPDRLRQSLGNLISNALRATPAGGTVSLHAARSEGAAVLRVEDTGTGIGPDALGHVFDRFWRADPARGRYSGGAGLGLAITRQFVTDLGGAITVASELGVGTTFTLTLPLAR
jgi:signal transduction histidine kinase